MTLTVEARPVAHTVHVARVQPGSAHTHRRPRLVAAPATEPPFDDERAFIPEQTTEGSLALNQGARSFHARPHLELVIDKPMTRQPVDDDESLFGRQPTPTAALPDARAWAARLGRAVAEVLTGDRPAQQLLRWTNDAVFADLTRRAAALGEAGTAHRGPRNRVSVISVHICEPRDGIAEAAVHVRQGLRSRAYALRLEGLDGRWRCTALQMG